MKVVIIEDEALAARRLASMIKSYDPQIEIVASIESVVDAVDWFSTNPHPDLIMLDIHLEDDLSFAIFEKVEINSPIIFTTAFDEYAIKAFKLKSIDYLLKPIVQEELNAALKKYHEMINTQRVPPDLQSLYSLLTQQNTRYRERFSVITGQRIKTFTTGEVAWFLSDSGYTTAMLHDGKEYFLDISLDNLIQELNPDQFYRINRKFIVALDSIRDVIIYPKSRLKLELKPKPEGDVMVSIDKSADFKKWLGANK
jgi:DNA-binding LytR/AlgR family response regulator